MSQTVDD